MTKGVLYIGFGANFIKEMLFSAESVKRNCPDMHITVFSDNEVDSDFVKLCLHDGNCHCMTATVTA